MVCLESFPDENFSNHPRLGTIDLKIMITFVGHIKVLSKMSIIFICFEETFGIDVAGKD